MRKLWYLNPKLYNRIFLTIWFGAMAIIFFCVMVVVMYRNPDASSEILNDWEREHLHECQEDQPCWDCKTMGNLLCGDDVIPATVYAKDSGSQVVEIMLP